MLCVIHTLLLLLYQQSRFISKRVLTCFAPLTQAIARASTLHYEFFVEKPPVGGQPPQSSTVVIHVPAADKIQEPESAVLSQLVQRYNVPLSNRQALRLVISPVIIVAWHTV